ncbi:cytochrome c [Verrucomicrobia bacterium]|nr:cytochrome c [Verrucomicrobiota bacterium]
MSDDNNISNDLPAAASRKTPFWIFVLTFVLIFLAGMFFDRKGGGANASVYEPYFSAEFVAKAHPPMGDIRIDRGRYLYKGACMACHQSSGLGANGVAPPLLGSEWVTGEGINRLAKIVYNGVQGPIEVKGKQWNLVMPAMGKQMAWSDSQIADVLFYIRANEEWANGASKVSPEDVTKALESARDRTTGWSASELLELPDIAE